ncbi:hypothetical protein AB0C04_20890 [Micromonospora sp. NPDC048909]|uniref:hypothetical protein n=1 Tax=Micromonospora sp. NPDC048909 TaxID=3155643 RepID=UPI0033F7C74A
MTTIRLSLKESSPVSTHCYIGVITPDNPRLVHARFVLFDCQPSVVLPTLAAIWAGHARYDTPALITAILAGDWEYLDPDITATTGSGIARQHPVPGVGMTLACINDGTVDGEEPVTVFPLCHAAHLDAEWIYLVEAGTATIGVHTGDGSRVASYQLSDCLPPPIENRRPPTGSRPTVGAPR